MSRDVASPTGPLAGLRVVEFAATGPVPFAAMMFADMGAEVIRVDRIDAAARPASPVELHTIMRGRKSIAVDLRSEEGVEVARRLVKTADALLEGFRPGVMERLGLGPDICLALRPKLVYGRMTGYGQEGPLRGFAGHDVNYLALAGVLAHVGPKERPVPPLALVGDFGGGAMFLIAGVLAGLLHARATGEGQVVDAAMTDGAAMLMTPFFDLMSRGRWNPERESNLGDGGAPFYAVYRTKDDRFMAVGALEATFYGQLLAALDLDAGSLPDQHDASHWPDVQRLFAERFLSKTRAEWVTHFVDVDACVTPVLTMQEAADHPALGERRAFVSIGGVGGQPAPAPRFSVTPSSMGEIRPPATSTLEVLSELGYDEVQIDEILTAGIIAAADSGAPSECRESIPP